MPHGRRPPPLFDLIREAPSRAFGNGNAARQRPTPIEPAPLVKTRTVEVRPREPMRPQPTQASPRPAPDKPSRTEPDDALKWLDAKRAVTMPVSRIYITAAAIIIAIVAIWWLAWEAGSAATLRKWEPRLTQQDRPPVTEPRDTQRPPTTTPTSSTQTTTPPSPTPQTPRADTRVPGSNYLLIASNLPESEARRAADFLTANGVPAIAVLVDSSGRDARTRNLFKIYSLLEIRSDEFSAKSQLRAQHKAEVARLGQIWQREHRGTANFSESQTLWEKYKP